MDHLALVRRRFNQYIFLFNFLTVWGLLLTIWLLSSYTSIPLEAILLGAAVVTIGLQALTTTVIVRYVTQPLEAVWQAILHLNPEQQGITAPQIDKLKVGQELVASLASQVYQLANDATKAAQEEQRMQADLSRNFIAQNLPLPLMVLDASETVIFANQAAAAYVGLPPADMMGKNVYMILDMSFPSTDTFDTWLKSVKNTNATASSSWERVRLNVRDSHPTRLFDMAAYYNRDNPEKNETMLVLFDHTKAYSQDEQAISFVALSVHELRTPLTLLRGYIEVFQEELGDQLDDEMKDFMHKMQSQSEQLTAFVNNILNVARVEEDQLTLQLQEEDWDTTLRSSIEAMSMRAKVRGITLKCSVQTGLPSVGVDRLSIREVINNLIDNAIKYSGDSKVIEIDTHLSKEGLVETTVRDYGLGISNNIMANLFTKFYRDHRNRAQIGGTGLGLFLSKSIVDAHGGSIWVQSKEGEGSTFGFTLMPYAQLAEELKQSGNNEITRGAHGWIKNHSLYRR
jgi:signal transduction histidine kinase